MRLTCFPLLLLALLSFANTTHALIAPQDLIFPAPDPELPNVRIVRTFRPEALRIESRDGQILRSFTRGELVHPLEVRSFTRDGAPWLGGSLILQDGNLFVIRLASKRLLVFDLETAELLSPPPPEEQRFFDFDSLPPPRLSEERLAGVHAKLNAKAMEHLRSPRLDERLVAARICGENDLREAIPILRDLARNDPGYWKVTTSHLQRGRRVYPVREAAAEALSRLENQ